MSASTPRVVESALSVYVRLVGSTTPSVELRLDRVTRWVYGGVMEITTRISSKPPHITLPVEHHYECSKDHPIRIIRFTSASPTGGFGSTSTRDCLFFEIEDAAHDSIAEAVATSHGVYATADYESTRDVATDLAERGDRLVGGARIHIRHDIEVS